MSRFFSAAHLPLTLLLLLQSTSVNSTTHPPTPESRASTTVPPQPLEQLIVETRKQYGDLVVRSARLTQQDKTLVYVINFTNSQQQWIRTVYDAHTARLISSATLKAPMPLEESLALIHKKYPQKNLIRSWLERRNGELFRIIGLADHQHKRYEIVQDAYTGQVISENAYELKPSGKEISLSEILKQAREKHKGMVVLQTRSTIKSNSKVREIIYLDEHRVRRKMIINAITGELLEDKITPWVRI